MIERASVVLPQPGLARERQDLALLEREVHAVDGARGDGVFVLPRNGPARPRSGRGDPAPAAAGTVPAGPAPDDARASRSSTPPVPVGAGLAPAGTPRGGPRPRRAAAGPRSDSGRTPARTAGGSCSRSAAPEGPAGRRRRPGRRLDESLVADPRERAGERLACTDAAGRVKTCVGGALLHDPARVHHGEPVAHLRQHREVVRDEQHREPELVLQLLRAAAGPAPAP